MKYPYFIKTTDGYIGRFMRLDWQGNPLYCFDGGNYRHADRWELENGSDDRAELEAQPSYIDSLNKNKEG